MKAFFILLAGALLCYLVAAVYPATSIATVFSVASAGFVSVMVLLDLLVLTSTFLFILGVRLNNNNIHYNLTMSREPLLQAIFNVVLSGATLVAEILMLKELWGMV